MSQKIQVAVGVIKNSKQQFLISKRHDHLHQGGLWEFPGGKIELGETVVDALARELHEELNITVRSAEPLIRISHQYVDKHVLLDVWLITEYDGTAESQQQQPLQWLLSSELSNYSFPSANQMILKCLSLTPYYAITGEFQNKEDFFEKFQRCLDNGIKLIQLRYKGDDNSLLMDLAEYSNKLCNKAGAKLLINSNPDFLKLCRADGVHLNSQMLHQYSKRPLDKNKILAASVHTKKDLLQAIKIKADFVVVSPVFKTTSHPDANTLGLNGLSDLVAESSIPVYALGGMKKDMLPEVKNTGAYGVAAISDFWN